MSATVSPFAALHLWVRLQPDELRAIDAAPLRAGPGEEDKDDETPIGDPEPDDFEGDDWEEDDDEPIHAAPRPPQGPGDVDDDELPMGDPPDDDESDDPDDEDEGEEDDEPLHGVGFESDPGSLSR